MPDFECFKNCEQFFVVDVIVELRWGKSPRMKSDRMNLSSVGDMVERIAVRA